MTPASCIIIHPDTRKSDSKSDGSPSLEDGVARIWASVASGWGGCGIVAHSSFVPKLFNPWCVPECDYSSPLSRASLFGTDEWGGIKHTKCEPKIFYLKQWR